MDEFDRRLSNEMKKRTEGILMSEQEKQQIHRKIGRSPIRKKRNFVVWTVAATAVALFLLLAVPLLKEQTGMNGQSGAFDVSNLEGITLSVAQKTVQDNGEIGYIIDITNDTSETIRGGVLSISYDLVLEDGFAGNPFKQSEHVPGDIYPRSSMQIKFAVDPTIFNQERIDLDGLSMELKGYANELSPETFFHVGQSTSVVE